MIFVSQAARKLEKLQQRHFLDHVAAPPSTLSGLKESFESGRPVTAKIALMGRAGRVGMGRCWYMGKRGEDPAEKGIVCWVSAMPLLDSEDNVGVWVVVIVDEKSAAANRGQVPDALLKRHDVKIEAGPHEKDGSVEKLDDAIERKVKAVGDIDGVFMPRLEEETLGISSQLPESSKSQKSEPILEKDQSITNGVPIESTNGSPMSSPTRSLSPLPFADQNHVPNGHQEKPKTPPRTEIEMASDTIPTQRVHRGIEAQSVRDVGLRTMDCLSCRTSIQQLKARDMVENGEEQDVDLNATSPHGVD
jgi:hypothetical protein